MKLRLLFIFLLCLPFALSAQQPLLSADTLSHQQVHVLQPFLSFLEDKSNQFTINEVLATPQQNQFAPLTPKTTTNSGSTYWLKFQIRSIYFRETNWIVAPATFGVADDLELYAINPYNAYIRKLGGVRRKAAETEFGSQLKHYLAFPLKQDSLPTMVYVKVRNFSITPPTLNYRIVEKSFALKLTERLTTINLVQQGVFQGMIWIILIYNLLLYFSTREKSYFYYALYLLGAAIYFIFRNSFLISDFSEQYPHLGTLGWFGSIGLTSVLYYVFMRSFFNTAQKHPNIDKLLRYGLYFQAVVMGGTWLYVAFTQDTFYALRFIFPPSVLQVGLSIYILYRLRTEGGKIAKYFVRGSAALLLSVIIYNIIFYGVVQFRLIATDQNVSRLNLLVEIGVIIEILFFSYGLGRKMQIAEAEKQLTDKQLIVQLKENERLQAQANQELESKVQERTLKLNETIEELNSILLLVNTQKKEIEEKKENITASINYAKRIQTAMMPTETDIQRTLPDSFVLFRPCDIVSGDFYYFAETIDKVIVAALDCTGHGVPGAFMSMIGNEILNEIVNLKAIYEADLIINHLHTGVRKALKQQDTDNKDGMDLALLVLHKAEKTLPNFQPLTGVTCVEYAGAMNPLYVCDHTGKLHEIKADKKPVGGSHFYDEQDRKFTKNLVYLCPEPPKEQENEETAQENEDKTFYTNQTTPTPTLWLNSPSATFYLSTDGYQDQFGGSQSKKFMPRRLRELLAQVQPHELSQQKQIIEQTFVEWLDDNEQIDDVLLMGIKVQGSW